LDSETVKRVNENLDLLDDLAEFAYEQGFHELGINPVKEIRKLLNI
jgi:hypothetical protein